MRTYRHLVLIGFMGSGKSTLGAEIARLTGLPFIDLDQEIEREEDLSIDEIFSSKGEAYFRKRESEVLHRLLENCKGRMILATGGGTVLEPANVSLLKRDGFILETKASLDEIIRRLSKDFQVRPLLKKNIRERVKLLFERRRGIYDFADLYVATDQMDIDAAATYAIHAWQGVANNKNLLIIEKVRER